MAAFLRVQNALILREIATRYGRTPGGFLWACWSRWPPFWC
jgi:ABC-type polysaccharide/polyol phosphate export permease